MQNNSARLAMALLGGRQDMASHSYNTMGAMRPDMGGIVNGQPSLPTPMQSMLFVNRGGPGPNQHARPKGKLQDAYAGMRTTVTPEIGGSANSLHPHINDMGNNPNHPAAQLASYLLTTKLTHPSMFYRGR